MITRREFFKNGVAAFTVSLSQRGHVYRYIRDQEEHHRKQSFAEEITALLARYGGNAAQILEDSVAPDGATESKARLPIANAMG